MYEHCARACPRSRCSGDLLEYAYKKPCRRHIQRDPKTSSYLLCPADFSYSPRTNQATQNPCSACSDSTMLSSSTLLLLFAASSATLAQANCPSTTEYTIVTSTVFAPSTVSICTGNAHHPHWSEPHHPHSIAERGASILPTPSGSKSPLPSGSSARSGVSSVLPQTPSSCLMPTTTSKIETVYTTVTTVAGTKTVACGAGYTCAAAPTASMCKPVPNCTNFPQPSQYAGVSNGTIPRSEFACGADPSECTCFGDADGAGGYCLNPGADQTPPQQCTSDSQCPGSQVCALQYYNYSEMQIYYFCVLPETCPAQSIAKLRRRELRSE